MTLFTDIFTTLGNFTLEQIWFPLLVWTVIAMPIALLLHWSSSIPSVYQYHGRVALMFALPFGIGVSYILEVLANSASQVGSVAKFFVIQTPLSVTSQATEPSLIAKLGDPILWIGLAGFLMILGAAYFLLKMLSSFIQLRAIEADLDFMPFNKEADFMKQLPISTRKEFQTTLLAFSDETQIPFTYGWQQTKIVIPAYLKDDSEALAMAVQHELMHIKHRDYLINGILLAIKSLFWIHPLAHYLHNSSKEYREIICDAKVLSSNHFSKKRYASLLFKLAQKRPQTNLALSMAVDLSTLKKRIQIMSDQTLTSTSFRNSFLIACMSASLIILVMGCSDMSEDGITKTEFQEAQSQVATAEEDQSLPLFIVNGEVFENKDKVTRIKSKYIKHIQVLKGENATDRYGSRAKNGALELTLNNPEKALSDLKDEEMLIVQKSEHSEEDDHYVSVENMPELVGGLASLQKEITYPEKARKAGIEGTVSVQFIVDKEGNVENPQILRGVGGGLDEEALRVVKQAKFKPGKDKNGNPVRVQYSLPIRFQLSKDKAKK